MFRSPLFPAVAFGVLALATTWARPARADGDCTARVEFVRHTLNDAATSADSWNGVWHGTMAALTVGQAAAIPLVDSEDRVDFYFGAGSSLVGLVSLATMRPTAIDDAPHFESRLSSPDRCALAREGERLLERGAEREASTTGVFGHIGNVVFNLGIGAVLGFGFHHWTSAILNVVAGTAIGETLLFTYPARLEKALARYRAGDFSLEPPGRVGMVPARGAAHALSFSFSF